MLGDSVRVYIVYTVEYLFIKPHTTLQYNLEALLILNAVYMDILCIGK